jgi:hypothetical protein
MSAGGDSAGANAEAEASWGSGDGSGSSAQGSGGDSAQSASGSVAQTLPSGPPIATLPTFEVLADGRSLVTVQVSGKTTATEQKAEGRLVYALKGVQVPARVNRMPLPTQNFETRVSQVQLEQTPDGANLVIDLREPAAEAQHTVSDLEGGTMLAVTIPKTVRYAAAPPTEPGTEPPPGTGTSGELPDTEEGQRSEEEGAFEREERSGKRRSQRQPIAYAARPLTLPHDTLSIEGGVGILSFPRLDTVAGLSAGLRWGIIDQLELEATPLLLLLSPDVDYVGAVLGITGGYTGNKFEIAGRARYVIPTRANTWGLLNLGVPMAIHLSDWGRIDTGAFVTLDDNRQALLNLSNNALLIKPGIPLRFIAQAEETFWLGATTGLSVFDFEQAGDTLAVPLGFEAGITIDDDRHPVVDLGAEFDFPAFVSPAAPDPIVADYFQLMLFLRGYIHL